MDKPITIDLFVEDRAHEEFLHPLVHRVARERRRTISLSVRSARGGHPRALSELELYQTAVVRGFAGIAMPDMLVIGIDANCQSYPSARREIESRLEPQFRHRAVIACPAPHVERWFLADARAFTRVVGSSPKVRGGKCQKDYYKALLAQAVVDGGHVPLFGGVEFAADIVKAMDLYAAGKVEKTLKIFLDDLGAAFERLQS